MQYPARRHLESFYIWEPSVYEALAVVAARCAQSVNDYSPDSDVKVVPILIKRIQGAAIIHPIHTMYIPPAGTTSLLDGNAN